MSFFEIVIPPSVAYLKPSDLILSSTPAIACEPYWFASDEMKSSVSRLESVWFMNGGRSNVFADEGFAQRALDLLVEDHAARRRQDQLVLAPAVLDRLLEIDLLGLDRELDSLLGVEALADAP